MKKARLISFLLVSILFMAMIMGSGQASQTKETTNANVSIEKAVLLDQNGIKITAKEIDTKGWLGPEVKMLFENNSDKAVTIQVRDTSVNGYMIDPMMSVNVAPGKKANDSMTFSNSDFELAGIEIIADIEFRFHVFDSETWNNLFDSELVRIETSAVKDYVYSFDNSGEMVFNNDGFEIVIKGLAEEDSWLGKDLVVYICNESNKKITVQAKDVSVNGFMIDPIFSCDVVCGKHAVDTITFMSSDLEANDITRIESVELSFQIIDGDNWNTIENTPAVTLNFN